MLLLSLSALLSNDYMRSWSSLFRYIHEFYTDEARELAKAAKDAKWKSSTSAPERPQENGVAERTVRRLKAGARNTFLKSGFGPTF